MTIFFTSRTGEVKNPETVTVILMKIDQILDNALHE